MQEKSNLASGSAPGQWFRTCQECGNEQVARKPDSSKDLTDSYRGAEQPWYSKVPFSKRELAYSGSNLYLYEEAR